MNSLATNGFEKRMDFQSFLAWSAKVGDNAGVKRFCETRIARALSYIRPEPCIPANPERVHRCDVVRLWCARRGIPMSLVENTVACEGVRHALQVIFAILARRGALVGIPSDVYPVYWVLAKQAGLKTHGFATFPRLELATLLAELARAGGSIALLPQPLKLQGRSWTAEELAVAEAWLRERHERRLIIDAVYAMGSRLGPSLTKLLETGQVLLLDSLSKGWLHEQIFGVAVVPHADTDVYSPTFRALVPSNNKLFVARSLLSESATLPDRIAEELDRGRLLLENRLLALRLRTLSVHGGYLLPIQANAEDLLSEHALLTIPISVFGSTEGGWSIASTLPSSRP